MIAASALEQRPADAKLLAVDRRGAITHLGRSEFVRYLRTGDLVVANDAATLPGSLSGIHRSTGNAIEIRLSGWGSRDCVRAFSAIVFGSGDFTQRTEDRPTPPLIIAGDQLEVGPLRAVVSRVLNHPRHIELLFQGSEQQIWEGIARHGRPIQYAHLAAPLALWDIWTAIASPPVAFEPPSAGFALDWRMLAAMSARRVRFATISHAAGISSTGDAALDALLPFDELYRIPASTARLIVESQMSGGRVIAIGTSVTRALEHAASQFGGVVPAGEGLATQKIGSRTRLRIVDAIFSGVHERTSSHYELLRAFTEDETLALIDEALIAGNYRTHEFGDSVFIEKANRKADFLDLLASAA